MSQEPNTRLLAFIKPVFNAVIAWVVVVFPVQYIVALYTGWRNKPIVTGWSDRRTILAGSLVAGLVLIVSALLGHRARREDARTAQVAAVRKRMPDLPPPLPRNRETGARPDRDAKNAE